MTATADNLDDVQKYSNCFPARTFLHPRQEGAGHWLVAYRESEEQRLRNLHRRIKQKKRKCDKTKVTDAAHGNTLDGPFLLQLHRVDEPRELCSIDISECKLKTVKQEDLKEFVNVAFIEASINSLCLESFSAFVSLKELNLSLNGIREMAFHAADFPHLEVLDLSYNSLSADAIVSIGQLPHLKVLHLTGNQIKNLPPNLSSSRFNNSHQPPAGKDSQFEALEVLMLDHNKLTSAVFSSLTNLRRLKYLNLQENYVSEIPYLQPSGSSAEGEDEEGFAKAENPNRDENVRRFRQDFDEDHCSGSCLPLPALQFLNLADNKIAEEDALMAAALFPALQEIDIQSNPLTTRRAGEPPVLTYYLHERLGIRIKRKKTQKAVKLPTKLFADPNWKFKETIPKVWRKPVSNTTPCPGSTQVEEKETTAQHKPESFFVTQVQAEQGEPSEKKERNEAHPNVEEFSSYQVLWDGKAGTEVVEPVGIQAAVRMLEHTLKSLNVYRDSKPKLDGIQTPYREREKRVKNLPPVSLKQPSERDGENIKEINQTSSIRVPLSSVINRSGVSKQDYKEAQALLRDMGTKYKMVHKRTMEQVANPGSDTNTN